MPKQAFHKRVKKYQLNRTEEVLVAIIGVFGFILLWRGLSYIMSGIPLLNNPGFLILLGFVLMYTSGLLIRVKK